MENSPTSASTTAVHKARPLYVDLDGCLVRSDLLVESLFDLLKRRPVFALLVPVWLMRGRAHLKHQLALQANIEPGSLPYNEEFLAYLRQERLAGRSLVLATSADRKFATAVADHLRLFDDSIASDGSSNLSGTAKLAAIKAKSQGAPFDYAGNSRTDLRIWPHANGAVLVNATRGVEKAAHRTAVVTRVFPRDRPTVRTYVKAARIHQWLKNLLLFVPLFAAHAWDDIQAVVSVSLGFVALSLVASGNYIINDLFDLSSDRQHLTKRARPFASGTIPAVQGLAIAGVAIAAGLSLATYIGAGFLGYVALYLAVSLAYSLYLKSFVMIDAVTLAGLYTLRLMAGGAAADIPISFWLLAFSMFLFFSLALVKRWSELTILEKEGRLATTGRDYRVSDLPVIGSMGVASGYLCVAVLALYMHSPAVARHYHHPHVLWLLCPTLLYWTSRMWIKAGRGEVQEDPLLYAVNDRASRILLAVGALVFALSV